MWHFHGRLQTTLNLWQMRFAVFEGVSLGYSDALCALSRKAKPKPWTYSLSWKDSLKDKAKTGFKELIDMRNVYSVNMGDSQ